MPLFRSLAIILLFGFASSAATAQLNAQGVTIIEAPSNFEFVDMGYDSTNNEVGIVGHIVNGADRTATVFELNASQDGFTAQTLADLPGATQRAAVRGISADASRIAGASSSTDSIDFEGTTWLRSDPNSPTGIGFTPNSPINNSLATGAWSGGVVGDSGGQNRPIIWDEANGIQELLGTGISIARAQDISSDGQITVGFSSHEIVSGAAYFWDSTGINRLDDSIVDHTLISSRARNISPNGNYIGGEISALDINGNFKLYPVVWEGPARTLRVLTDSNGDFIQGSVSDVSNMGITVGLILDSNFDISGFIDNPEFTNGAENFESWLETISPGISSSFISLDVNSIATGNGELFFAVNGSAGESVLVNVEIGSEPGEPGEPGDVNQDGKVNFLDISPFIQVLSSGEYQIEADVNQSGEVNFLDISPFIQVLSS